MAVGAPRMVSTQAHLLLSLVGGVCSEHTPCTVSSSPLASALSHTQLASSEEEEKVLLTRRLLSATQGLGESPSLRF